MAWCWGASSGLDFDRGLGLSFVCFAGAGGETAWMGLGATGLGEDVEDDVFWSFAGGGDGESSVKDGERGEEEEEEEDGE